MKAQLLLLIFIFLSTIGYSHTGWTYRGSKNGITLIVSCNNYDKAKEHKQQEAFLDLLAKKLNRYDETIQILILGNPFGMYPSMIPPQEWFVSLGFDTLREPDIGFIYDYYSYKKYTEENHNAPSNKYKIELSEPLNINIGYDDSNKTTGLKLICGHQEWDSTISYERIFTLIQYGLDHIAEIKEKQKKLETFLMIDDNYKVFSLSLDTSTLKSLPLLPLGFNPLNPGEAEEKINQTKLFTIIICSAVLIVILITLFRKRVKSKRIYQV